MTITENALPTLDPDLDLDLVLCLLEEWDDEDRVRLTARGASALGHDVWFDVFATFADNPELCPVEWDDPAAATSPTVAGTVGYVALPAGVEWGGRS